MRKTPNPFARNGSTRLQWLFSRPRRRMKSAFGTTIDSYGTMIVAMNSQKIGLRSGSR